MSQPSTSSPSCSSSLASIGAHLRATIQAHSAPCNIVRYNTLGRYILTGGSDRHIHLYNATNPSTPQAPAQPIKSYTAHSHPVLALAISSDNLHFASGGSDRSVYVWDVATATILRRFNAHLGNINVVELGGAASSAAAGGDSLLAAAGYDGTVRLYDLRSQGSWKPIMELKQSRDAILSLALTSSRIYTGSVDGHVRTYDLRAGVLTSDLVDAPVSAVRPSRNETSLLVSTLDSTVRLFDTETGACLQSLTGHKHVQYRCRAVLTADEDGIVMGDEAGSLQVWDVVSKHRREVIPAAERGIRGEGGAQRAHTKAILWTEVNPAADRANEVVTAGADGVVKVWTSILSPERGVDQA